jgi:hypothetical protein
MLEGPGCATGSATSSAMGSATGCATVKGVACIAFMISAWALMVSAWEAMISCNLSILFLLGILFISNKIMNAHLYYPRLFIILFVFIVSIYCATISFRSPQLLSKVLKLKGEDEMSDPNFEQEDEKNIKRWRRIMQMLIVFICLTIAYFIACLVAIAIILFAYYEFMDDDDNQETWPKVVAFMKDIFMLHDVTNLYSLFFIIIFGALLFFLIYHLLVKKVLPLLYYSDFVKSDKDKQEFLNPVKFIMFYGIYIILLVIFCILLYTYTLNTLDVKEKSTDVFDILVYIGKVCFVGFALLTYIMFTMLIYRFTMARDKPFQVPVLFVVMGAWTLLLYFLLSFMYKPNM